MFGHSHTGETDEVLDTLCSPIRRRLLFSLYERGRDDGELPIQHVSGLAFEEGNIWAELHHVHLPKLQEKGYVRWDSDEHTITRGPEWNQIEPLLRLVYNHLNELPP